MASENQTDDLTVSERTWNSLVWKSLLGALWLISVIIFGDAFLHESWVLIQQPKNIYFFVAALGVISLLVACYWIFKLSLDMDNAQLWWLALFVVVAGFSMRLIWVLIFDSYQVSDFGIYLRCGIEIVAGQIDTCVSPVYWKRGLFVTAPVVSLFGPKLAAIESFNLFIYFLSGCLFFLLAYRLSDLRVAILGLVLFSVAPDLFYPITLASHDLHGVFWLLLFFLLTILLEQLLRSSSLTGTNFFWLLSGSLLLGLLLTALDYSRSYSLIAIAALMLVAGVIVIEKYRSARKYWVSWVAPVLFLLILPLFMQSMAKSTLDNSFLRPEATRPHALLNLVTATDITSVNGYLDLKIWRQGIFPELVSADRLDFAVSKWVHEWSHDLTESVAHLFRKNHVLAEGGGNFNFARGKRPQLPGSDVISDQVGRVNYLGWQLQDRTIRLLNILLLGLCLARVLLVRWIPFRRSELVVIAFSTIAYLAILLLLETQPRYTVFLLIPAAYMGGQALAWLFHYSSGCSDLSTFTNKQTARPLLAGASLLLVTCILGAAGLKVLAGTGMSLDDLSAAEQLDHTSFLELRPEVNAVPVVLEAQFNRIELGFPGGMNLNPGDAMGARLVLPAVPDGNNMLEGFVIINPENMLGEPSLDELGLEACLYKDRQSLMCAPIRDFKAHFLQINDADKDGDGWVELTILVIATHPIDEKLVPNGAVIRLAHLRIR